MKTFNEWLIEKDPEFLDEGKIWNAVKSGIAGAGMGAAMLAGADDVQAAYPKSIVQPYHGEYSPVKFDVAHAVETLGLSSKYLAKPETVYNLMMSRWKKGELDDSQFSKLFDKYKEPDPNNPRKWIANPPSCC
jgi:hypothetical protein